MELSHILQTLFRRKLELALTFWAAALFAVLATHTVSIWPLKAEKRAIELGAASTQMLVDSPMSSLVDLEQDTGPLSTRAAVYAQFMRSNVVRSSIAAKLGIPVEEIVAEGPFTTLQGRQNITRPGEARANEVRSEGQEHRLVFDHQEGLPIVSVFAQAPSPDRALELANASVEALQEYVTTEEINQSIPEGRRTVIRELGPAQGGWVNNGVNPIFMALAFAAALGIGCFLILITDAPLNRIKLARRRRKALKRFQHGRPEPEDLPSVDDEPAVTVGFAAYDYDDE